MKKNTPNISMLSSLAVFFLCNLACHIRILEVWVTTQRKRKVQNTQKHLRKSVGDTFLFYRNDRGYLVTGLLIARSKFLQRNVYASMLKEKDTCQIKTNERSQPLLWLLFSLKLTTFYTFRSFVWPKKWYNNSC